MSFVLIIIFFFLCVLIFYVLGDLIGKKEKLLLEQQQRRNEAALKKSQESQASQLPSTHTTAAQEAPAARPAPPASPASEVQSGHVVAANSQNAGLYIVSEQALQSMHRNRMHQNAVISQIHENQRVLSEQLSRVGGGLNFGSNFLSAQAQGQQQVQQQMEQPINHQNHQQYVEQQHYQENHQQQVEHQTQQQAKARLVLTNAVVDEMTPSAQQSKFSGVMQQEHYMRVLRKYIAGTGIADLELPESAAPAYDGGESVLVPRSPAQHVSVPAGFATYLKQDHAKMKVTPNSEWIHPSRRTDKTGLNCDLTSRRGLFDYDESNVDVTTSNTLKIEDKEESGLKTVGNGDNNNNMYDIGGTNNMNHKGLKSQSHISSKLSDNKRVTIDSSQPRWTGRFAEFRRGIMSLYGPSCKVKKAKSTNANYGLRVLTPLSSVFMQIHSYDLGEAKLSFEEIYSKVTGFLTDEFETLNGDAILFLPFINKKLTTRRLIPSSYQWKSNFENGGLCKDKNGEQTMSVKSYHDSWSIAMYIAKTMCKYEDTALKNKYFSNDFFDDEPEHYFDAAGVRKFIDKYCNLCDDKAIDLATNSIISACHHLKFILICNSEYFENDVSYKSTNKFAISLRGENHLAQLHGGYYWHSLNDKHKLMQLLELCGSKLSIFYFFCVFCFHTIKLFYFMM